MLKKTLKRLGLPMLALAGALVFVGTPQADARVRFGVYVGPGYYPYAYTYPAYAYPYDYGYPYYYGGYWVGGHYYHGGHWHGRHR
jgi:hypothetical protein